MRRLRSIRRATLAVAGLAAAATLGCATLGSLGIRPLRIQSDPGRRAELRLGSGLLPTSSIDGTVFLEDARVGVVDLPLGLPLESGMEEVIPLDVTVRFSDLPGLGGVVRRALGGEPLGYRLEGGFSIDAGQFGRPTCGPMTLLQGEVRAFR
jgi:hypothetical protein